MIFFAIFVKIMRLKNIDSIFSLRSKTINLRLVFTH
jgi:hypothetical protein